MARLRSRTSACWALSYALTLVSVLASTDAQAQGTSPWPSAVARAELGLASKDISQRTAAVRALLRLPASAAQRLLPKALADDVGAVRSVAAEVALALGFEPAAQIVVPWLSDTDDDLRRVAVRVVGAFPLTDASVNGLARALSDPQPEVRREAAVALGGSARPEVTPALLAHLDDANPLVQVAIIEALAGLRDERAVVPLVGKLQEPRSAIRKAAADALASFGNPRAASALLLVLVDSDEWVRLAAVRAVGMLRAREGIPALVSVLTRDRVLSVRVGAASALAGYADPAAASVLVETLNSPIVELASAAEHALLGMADTALPPVRSCLAAGTPGAQTEACARLLVALAPTDCAAAIANAWRQQTLSPVGALDALAAAKDEAALPLVLESLADSSVATRVSAVRAATTMLDVEHPDGRAVEPILRAIASKERAAQELAPLLELLGRTGALRVEPALSVYLKPENPASIRISALTGLSFLSAVSGPPGPFLDALADPNPGVRWAALQVARNAGQGAWAALILDRLEAAPRQDRETLLLALAGPTSRGFQANVAERLVRRLSSGKLAESDGLLEALGRMPGAEKYLRSLWQTGAIALRPKLAEMLSGYPALHAELTAKLPNLQVPARANAVWSLGSVGAGDTLPLLLERMQDSDAVVAANAVAAAALVAQRTQLPITPALCAALVRAETYVQANALVGLRLLGARCSDGREISRLRHPSSVVRERAAWLLRTVPGAAAEADAQALLRCQNTETDSGVAAACQQKNSAPQVTEKDAGVTLYVTANGGGPPLAQTPFALVSNAGFIRLGWADRRGVVFDRRPFAAGATLVAP